MKRLFIFFFSLMVAACGRSSGSQEAVLRRGLSGDPATLDPGAAADTFSTTVLLDLYEGLTSESANGEVAPGVAESWSVSESGTEYTFKLRKTARWSNGKPVRAQDFVATWRRDVAPEHGSAAADNLRFIKHASSILARKEAPTALSVFAPQDDILVVELEQPTAFFPQILAHPTMFPVFDPDGPNTHNPAKWVSNGPYVLTGWQPATGMDLMANPSYWAKDSVKIKRIRYQFTPGEASQYAAYRAGELDLTDTVPANALPAIRRDRPAELFVAPFLGTVYYGLNIADKRMSNIELRKALAMAIDRKRLVDSLGFGQSPAFGLVPPGTTDYSPQSWTWSSLTDEQRIAEARDHYLKAGYSRDTPVRLRVLLNENEVIRRTAVLIGAMWKETLGVEISLQAEEYKVFLQTRFDKTRWDVARLAWNADFNDAGNFLEITRTTSPNNDMSYANSDVDVLLDRAASATNKVKRRESLEEAEKRMLDDYPLIPLYFFVSKRLVRPYVRGATISPLNHVPSKLLSLDPH